MPYRTPNQGIYSLDTARYLPPYMYVSTTFDARLLYVV